MFQVLRSGVLGAQGVIVVANLDFYQVTLVSELMN